MINMIRDTYNKSIKRQLIIAVGLTHAVMMSIFILDLTNNQKDFLHNQSVSQVKSLARTLSRNSTSWVLSSDYIGMEEIINSISTYPDLKYAMLLDKNGKVLAHTNKENINKYITDSLSTKLLSTDVTLQLLVNNKTIVDVAVPILRDTQHIGWARIAIGQERNIKGLNEVVINGIIYTLIAILIGGILAYILSTSMTKSLYNLIDIAKQTTFGTKYLRADESRADELGSLAKEINIMLDTIDEKEQKLSIAYEELERDNHELEILEKELVKLNKSLEEKVQNKTKELQQLNEHLKEEIENEVELNRQKDTMLFQQSKMAAMGEMLENIAHQWRQPLSVISTSASGIKLEKEYGILTDEFLIDALGGIVRNTQHLSNTIDDFRDFFKTDKPKENFILKHALDKTLEIVSSKFKNRNIEVVENIEDIEVFGLENELVQVIMNILNNAKDVLENIEAQRYIFIDIYKKDEDVIISIKDNGGGIPDAIINRVFEPYFTTKHKSQGTGIGLYMSEEIVVKHMSGKIIVENEEYVYANNKYKGAKFSIVLPLH